MAPPLTGSSLIPASELRPGISPAATSGSRATNERGDYDDQTGCVGSAVPHDHGGGSGAQGHVAHVQGSSGESRQGSSDDHSRACARWVERYPPTQCTCVHLRAGGLGCDAAKGWTTGDTDTRTDLL